MDLQGSDSLICPLCGYEYDVSVEEARIRDGFGIENSDIEQCDGCNETFLIIEYDDFYSVIEHEDD